VIPKAKLQRTLARHFCIDAKRSVTTLVRSRNRDYGKAHHHQRHWLILVITTVSGGFRLTVLNGLPGLGEMLTAILDVVEVNRLRSRRLCSTKTERRFERWNVNAKLATESLSGGKKNLTKFLDAPVGRIKRSCLTFESREHQSPLLKVFYACFYNSKSPVRGRSDHEASVRGTTPNLWQADRSHNSLPLGASRY